MKYNIFLLFLFSFCQGFSQISYVNNSCFCVEESINPPNILYNYSTNLQSWFKTGAIVYNSNSNIKAQKIEAIAMNPVENVIYSFDGDKFGKIKIGTAKFELINDGLTGDGKINGTIIKDLPFGDVDGLTYNPYTRELWATNRLIGYNANDILFKIDPTTGKVIKDIFDGYDFVEIEESYDATYGGVVYDVEDIAVNLFTNQLFAIQNQNGPGIISEINKEDGTIEQEIFDLNEDDIEGLGFSGYGYLYGSTGDSSDVASSLIAIDFVNFETNNLDAIDLSLPGGIGDFESFDCVSDYVDLALDAKIKSKQQTFNKGDIVEIEVTVYNQGTIEIDDLQIAMHLPLGLTVLGAEWTNPEAGQIYLSNINSLFLNSNKSYSNTVQLVLDNPSVNLNTVAFEISRARNSIISIGQGFEIDLPDVDSKPDLINQELNVKNDEINENGVFGLNEDEDDHDIATFGFVPSASDCLKELILPKVNNTIYNAENTIQTTAIIEPGFSVEMYAGKEITINNDFSATKGATFVAGIRSCGIE